MHYFITVFITFLLLISCAGVEQSNSGDATEEFVLFDADGRLIRTGRDAEGRNAVVTAAQHEAARVGLAILRAGGNAVDAAVATAFALSACEPYYSGIGGGGFMTIRFAETGEVKFIDFRERAPMAADHNTWPKDENGDWVGYYQMVGGPSVGVPGEVKGLLYALETYGSMQRRQIMEPAISLAADGFIVGPTFSDILADYYSFYQMSDESVRIFFNDGLPYQPGELYQNPDLANTLRLIRDQGEAGFYQGAVAEAIVAAVNDYGGQMDMQDLADYQVKTPDPVTGTYRGYQIFSSPPPSSGGTIIIEILNILENFDVAGMEINSPEYIHLFSEIFKIAFADRGRYMGDSDFVSVPITGLTEKAYAKQRAGGIDLAAASNYSAGDPTIVESANTTHFSVMDRAGNMVSVSKTINYGAGITPPTTGLMLNNEMADFSTGAGKANSIEGGKTPLSSMSPTLILRDGQPFMVVGSPGGTRIITTVALIISRVIDHRMDIQQAIDTLRFFDGYNELKIEGGIDTAIVEQLQAMGHKVSVTEQWDRYYGGVHAIVRKDDGTLRGGADPRRDGKALAF